MEAKDILLKDLTGKDEIKGQKAANNLINNVDKELYKMLVEKSDFLFPFVRNNVIKRIENAVTKTNYSNIIKFFDYYSPYYDDLFASILAKHANEDLTDNLFELLENGSTAQKTYTAKYFTYIPDTIAIEALSKYMFCDDEYLSANCVEALGQMQDDVSYDIALNTIETEDDLEKLKAVKFFCAYGRNYPFKEIFKALKSSKIPENIAGQIPYMESLLKLLNTGYKEDTIYCIYYIISGLGEILPLSDIFQFELYEVLNRLITYNREKSDFSQKIAVVLLSALAKFKILCENEEYIYDEDKDTKYEINSILKLMQSQNKEFWKEQERLAVTILNGSDKDILMTLPVITEYKIKEAEPILKQHINTENEVLIYEIINTLKSMNLISGIDLNKVIQRVKNPNIKALIENITNS